MISPSLFHVAALLTGFCAVSARSSRRPRQPYYPIASHRSRGTGTGPHGVLAADDSVTVTPSSHTQGAGLVHSLAFADEAAVEEGEFNTCLEPTTATAEDCEMVINDIKNNNGTISVAPGFCLNWWEGGCHGQVCGRNQVYSQSSWGIADTMTTSILDICITQGQSGVAADCADWKSDGGTYWLKLQAYGGNLAV